MLWIVAATGESLTHEVAAQCAGHNIIAINDAYQMMPFARILYAADDEWWKLHKGCADFSGAKWTTFGELCANSRDVANQYGLRLIESRRSKGFSFERGIINRGGNSGFQAVNLALQLGGNPLILVGFDMHGSHFFGDHPQMPRRSPGNKRTRFQRWIRNFERAAETLPAHITIINATPGSALKCFPMMSLSEALDGSGAT